MRHDSRSPSWNPGIFIPILTGSPSLPFCTSSRAHFVNHMRSNASVFTFYIVYWRTTIYYYSRCLNFIVSREWINKYHIISYLEPLLAMGQVGGYVQLIDQPVALRRVQFLRRRQELLLKGLLCARCTNPIKARTNGKR